ncbi:MAG: tetratricopeptide repeat protein [Chitinophagaceae bacterium]|nr:tetratricopeptide repeat protein [Chitinophagaceae bacterium]
MLLSIGLLMAACNGDDKNAGEENTSILKNPPYATLTDSIRRSGKEDRAGLYYKRAELLSRNDLHELAAADFQKAWELHPDEATGLRYASTLTIISHLQDAVRLLQECRQKFPGNQSFSNMLGDLYQQSGQTKEALQLYDDMLKSDSLNFEAWYEKGLLLEKIRDTASALKALRKAWSLQPINTYALELAHLYAENRNSAAIDICDAVLQKDSTHELIDPLFIKGIYYSNIGENKQALIQFDSCIRRDWKFTDAYLEKGIILFHEKKYTEAQEVFQMAIRVSNTYPDGYYWLGRCYEATGHKEEAILFYQRTLALDKDFTEARDAIRRLK